MAEMTKTMGSGNLIEIPPKTFKAKMFESPWEGNVIKVSGTLDGFIDLAMPQGGTFPLTIGEAEGLIASLKGSISDVKDNCMYESDALMKGFPE